MTLVPALLLLAATFDETYRAGLMALQRGDLPAAQAALEEAAKLQSSNGRVWVALAEVYNREDRRADAKLAVHRAQTAAGRDPVVAQTLGIYYQKLLGEQKFVDVLELVRNAADAQSQLALGVACYGLRRFDEAAAAFLQVIALDPQVEQPYLFLGRFLDQVPARREAIAKRFEEFAAAHPDDSRAWYLMSKVHPADAEKLLRRSLDLNSADAAAHFDLGALLDARKNFAGAAAEFEASVRLNPGDAAAHYRLSRVYDRLGRSDDANREREAHRGLVRSEDAAK